MEELECLATWNEGNARYLVGKMNHRHAITSEDRYRCFVYEKITGIGESYQAILCIIDSKRNVKYFKLNVFNLHYEFGKCMNQNFWH